MFSRDRWQEIFQTISKNRLRTFLSGFTVALGIFIFTVLFGMGNGLKNTFNEFFMDDATNTFFIFPGRTSMPYKGFKKDRQIEFRNDDLEDIKKDFALYLDHITPRISKSALARYKGESNTYTTRAVAPSHQIMEKTIIMKGRYINEKDIKDQAKNIVIGRLVEIDLFGRSENALGKFLEVGGVIYKVVGVFQDDGGDNEERYIYMPYTTRQLLDKGTDKIDQIILTYKTDIGYAGAMAFDTSLFKYLKEKHKVAPQDQNGIYLRNTADIVKRNMMFANVLQWVVIFVGIGTLIAGVIGISNIMVFVVKERTKELGIRKALGATPASVIGLVLQESIFITTIAGYIGLVLGVGILSIMGNSFKEDYFITNPQVGMDVVITATLILILFGVIAGYVPARRAARVKPIVALRDE
ncbi:ABC transporter permease [Sinomicrobium weinanense]|uniref:ABC transporter permease n=1 Tax=Sinomicrobium weinanense TaxID=2842200 RepID=A0A926Q2H0_9FLAO|nr:ABC transporter permease [Sinomicrobium weinanense]MBC9796642.1 ABC transporter permease [Sinomicrobium weinanense]MBU3124891.1 ABC transporter permease [Sinomicrobium weinanense]